LLVVVTGGGTGGHVYPGLAVSRELLNSRPEAELLFVGSAAGPERGAAAEAGLEFEGLPLSGLAGRGPLKGAAAAARFARGTARCIALFRRRRPACVVGTGGYVAAPACFAALLAGIPLILHEMNLHPGLVTRMLASRARAVACAHQGTAAMLSAKSRVVVTGVAVRPAIVALADGENRSAVAEKGRREFGLAPGKRTLLVFGGSQGAGAVNVAVWEMLSSVSGREDLQVLHITGRRDYDDERRRVAEGVAGPGGPRYRAIPFLERMELAYSVADLALTRAGAGTVAELEAALVPGVLVPYPFATESHQESNAEALAAKGAAIVVRQEGDSAVKAAARAFEVLRDAGALESMKAALVSPGGAGAAERIVELIKEVV